MPGNTPDSSARVVWLANLRKGVTTHFHNVPLHVAKSLDIIDNGRALVETENGGKIGRFDPRIGSLPPRIRSVRSPPRRCMLPPHDEQPSHRSSQCPRCFFRKTLFLSLKNGSIQNFRTFEKFSSDIDESLLSLNRVGGDHHSFDQLMRILVNDLAILESSGLGFIRIAD